MGSDSGVADRHGSHGGFGSDKPWFVMEVESRQSWLIGFVGFWRVEVGMAVKAVLVKQR